MYRLKILHSSLSKFKPRIINSIMRTGRKGNLLYLTHQNIASKKIEAAKLYKGFSLLKKYLSNKISKMYVSHFSEPICWKCKKTLKMVKFMKCSECGTLQPPKTNLNYFELLGITQAYDINMEDMSENYKKLQMMLHPDKVENKSQAEKDISESYSKLLNKAYKTLKDPVSRGFYLLEQKNDKKCENPLDQHFIATIMEKNEELETLDNISSLNEFYEDNKKQIQEQFDLIRKAFQNNDFLDAKVNLLRLNYFLRLNDKVQEKISTFRSSSEK